MSGLLRIDSTTPDEVAPKNSEEAKRTSSTFYDDVHARSRGPESADELPRPQQMEEILDELYRGGAGTYDRQLLVDCAYQTPKVLAQAVAQWARRADLPAGNAPSAGNAPCADLPAGNAPSADPGTGRRWLDLGAGTGLVGRALRDHNVKASLAAVDRSLAMLQHVDRALYSECCVADANGPLPFPDSHFDVVLAASLMEHIVDPRPMLHEVTRVLAPDGLLFLTFCPNQSGRPQLFEPLAGLLSHDETALRTTLTQCRYHVEQERDFDAYRSGRGGWVRSRLVIARRRAAS